MISKDDIFCKNCGTNLRFDLCIYNEFDLILKPELITNDDQVFRQYFVLHQIPKANKYSQKDMKCSMCSQKLGKVGEIGPGGEIGYKLSVKDLRLTGYPGIKKPKELFGRGVFEERDSSSFYGSSDSSSFYGSSNPNTLALTTTSQKHPSIETIIPTLDKFNHGIDSIKDLLNIDELKIPRPFQMECYFRSLTQNSIIILPTGSGKTLTAALLIAKMFQLNPLKLIFFIVDRIPLVEQQKDLLGRYLNQMHIKICHLYGDISTPAIRKSIINGEYNIIVITAQIVYDMLKDNSLQMEKISLLVFDEAHHARSKRNNHAYLRIMTDYYFNIKKLEERPLVLGLTASPIGENTSEKSKFALDELCSSYQARPVYPVLTMENLSSIALIPNLEKTTFNYHIAEIDLKRKVHFYLTSFVSYFYEKSKKFTPQMLELISISKGQLNVSGPWKGIFTALKNEQCYNEINNEQFTEFRIILDHMLTIWNAFERNEIEGPKVTWNSINQYIDRESQKSIKIELIRANLHHLKPDASSLKQYDGYYSTRTDRLLKLLRIHLCSINNLSRGIVFVEKRFFADELKKIIEKDQDLKILHPETFVGLHTDNVTFEKQKWTLDRFRCGQCRLLIATSVLEEGIDVKECNLVVRFNSTYSLTAFIQSRGRARKKNSQFIVFGTEEEIEFFNNVQEQEYNMLNSVLISCQSSIKENEQEIIRRSLGEYKTQIVPTLMAVKQRTNVILNNIDLMLEVYVYGKNLLTKFKSILDKSDSEFFETEKGTYLKLKTKDKEDHYRRLFRLFKTPDIMNLLQGAHIEIKNHITDQNSRSLINIEGKTLQFGFALNTKIEFSASRLQFKSFTLTLNPDDFKWNFKSLEDDKEILSIGVSDIIDGVIFLQYPKTDSLQLSVIFPIRVAPKLGFLNEENKYERRPLDLSYQPFLLNGTLEFNDYENLVNFLSLCKYFHLRIKFASIKVEQLRKPEFDSLAEYFTESNDFREEEEKCTILSYICRNPWISPSVLVDALKKHGREGFRALEDIGSPQIWNDFIESTMANHKSIVNGLLKYKSKKVVQDKENYIWVRQILLTPSRSVLLDPMLLQSNRVTREYGSSDFLLVRLLDEDFDRFDSGEVGILNHFKKLLKEGIHLPIPNGNFRLVGFSNSQFRERHAWLTRLHISEIHDWIGDFFSSRCRGKVVKRLGLAFSSSIPTIDLTADEIDFTLDDIKRDRSVFSDGIGRISIDLAKTLSSILNLDYTPSAFQIRVAGIKGVVTVCPIEYLKVGLRINFRESMKKCKSKHKILEVLSFPRKLPATLNSQILNLLSSLGIEDEIFMDLLKDELKEIRLNLSDPQKCKTQLAQMDLIKVLIDPLLKKGIDILREPFFLKALQSKYDASLLNIRGKFRISILKGMSLMGVLDESNEIPEGHIFIQLTETGMVKENEAVITRNPCLHPGDIRVVKLYRPKNISPFLKLMVNCVVFSQQGTMNIPSACAGGDLDGDYYTVIWDPRLIPNAQEQPHYLDDTKAKEWESPIQFNDIIDFAIFYWNKDNLGSIANAHVVASDLEGALSKKAKTLAELHATAVDFPKTEINPEFDKELKPRTYPDFMDKSKFVYPSKKIHGKIYRYCRGITWVDQPGRTNPIESVFYCDEYQPFLEFVRPCYIEYCQVIQGLIGKYGLKSEMEIISGSLLNILPIFKSSKERNSINLAGELDLIWNSYRELFFEKFKFANEDEFFRLFYACYYVAHNDSSAKSCLSFPWAILGQQLIEASKKFHSFGLCVEEILGKAILNDWNNHQNDRISSLRDRIQIAASIDSLIQNNIPESSALIFGSSANFLFNIQESDIDLCMISKNECINPNDFDALNELKVLLENEKEDLAINDVDVKYTFTPPIVRFTINLEDSHIYNVDISANQNSTLKIALLVPLFDRYPFLVPVINYLGVFLKKGNFKKIISSFGFAWLIIYLLDQELDFIKDKTIFKQSLTDPKEMLQGFQKKYPQFQQSQFGILSFWKKRLYDDNSLKFLEIGKGIIIVLEKMASLRQLELPDPVYPEKEACVSFSKDENVFSAPSDKLLHVISKYAFSNLEKLVDLLKCVDKTFSIVSMGRTAASIYNENRIYQESNMMENLLQNGIEAKMLPKIEYILGKNWSLLVKIDGYEKAVICAENYFTLFIDKVEGQKNLSKRKTHFAENSSLLLYPFDGTGSETDSIQFDIYNGPHHFEHAHTLYKADVGIQEPGPRNAHLERFVQAYQRQMVFLNSKMEEYKDLFQGCSVSAVARFGRYYLFHVNSEDYHSLKLPSVKNLEERIASKGIYQPWQNQINLSDNSNVSNQKSHKDKQSVSKSRDGLNEDERKSKDNELQQKSRINPVISPNNIVSKSDYDHVGQSFFTSVFFSEKISAVFGKQQRDDIITKKQYVDVSLAYSDYRLRINPETLDIISISTRAVRWLAATCHGKKATDKTKQQDMRIYLDSVKRVPIEDPIWELCKNEKFISFKKSGEKIEDILIEPEIPYKIRKVRVVDRVSIKRKFSDFSATLHESDLSVFNFSDDGKRVMQRDYQKEMEIHVDDRFAISRDGFAKAFYTLCYDAWIKIQP